jgi:hypothetical protein
MTSMAVPFLAIIVILTFAIISIESRVRELEERFRAGKGR